MSNSLLPPNSTQLEKNIETVFTSRFDALAVDIRNLWNPDACPVQLLPWLAWALNVDEWNSAWSEQQRRDVLRTAVEVHQKKGCAVALQNAASALGNNVSVSEWFQHGGAPHSFRADVEIPVTGLSENTVVDIVKQTNRAKNARSHLSHLRLTSHQNASTYFGACTIAGDRVSIFPEAFA